MTEQRQMQEKSLTSEPPLYVTTSSPVSLSPEGSESTSRNISDPAERNSIQEQLLPHLLYSTHSASFTYGVLPNPNTLRSPGSAQSSSNNPVVTMNLLAYSAVAHPNAPGFSTIAPSNPEDFKNLSSAAAMSQLLVPGKSPSLRPVPFTPGTALPPVPPPPSPSFPIPERSLSNVENFSFANRSLIVHNDESLRMIASAGAGSELRITPSAESPVHTSVNHAATASSTVGLSQPAISASGAPSNLHLVMPSTTDAIVPPGMAASSALSLLSALSSSKDSSSVRPILPPAPLSSSLAVYPQAFPSHPSMPPPSAGNSPQAPWVQVSVPQMSGFPRPHFLPYAPPVYPVPFPLVPRAMPPSSASLPGLPGPVGRTGPGPWSYTVPGNQQATMQKDLLPPGIDGCKGSDVGTEDVTPSADHLEAWSAHRTESGTVYYYNAITGESTYDKPAGFTGKQDAVNAQPTPVSWEKLAGTDWSLVTTNDGKNYYYNSKTKISSWQIPVEVAELRKKQETDKQEESFSLDQNNNSSALMESCVSNLSAPALSSGGRDSMALRPSNVPGSSALDLVKKKLQESGYSEVDGSKAAEAPIKALQGENSKDKPKETNGNGNISESSSDSEDEDSGPTMEERIIQFKEMLKEHGVAPFSKWDKELPKILFDPRFKAIPSYAERRSLFEYYVRTRAEEVRKEKRAAQKAAVEGFKQLLQDADKDISEHTTYQVFRKKWGNDPRFEALDHKERELLLHERVLQFRKAAENKTQVARAAFKSMLRENEDITASSRWSRVKESLRDDPRYKAVVHEEREALFNEHISELKAQYDDAGRSAKAEEDKLKERERELRKRKEREELEMERVRIKVRRKEAVSSYQALLVETIKDPQASWTESKPKLEKDPQGRASNPDLDRSDLEKLFRDHMRTLHERCVQEYKALLHEVITTDAVTQKRDDGKTVITSWSAAKSLLSSDPRYKRLDRKEREAFWRRHVEDIQRKEKAGTETKDGKLVDSKRSSIADTGRSKSASKSSNERR